MPPRRQVLKLQKKTKRDTANVQSKMATHFFFACRSTREPFLEQRRAARQFWCSGHCRNCKSLNSANTRTGLMAKSERNRKEKQNLNEHHARSEISPCVYTVWVIIQKQWMGRHSVSVSILCCTFLNTSMVSSIPVHLMAFLTFLYLL